MTPGDGLLQAGSRELALCRPYLTTPGDVAQGGAVGQESTGLHAKAPAPPWKEHFLARNSASVMADTPSPAHCPQHTRNAVPCTAGAEISCSRAPTALQNCCWARLYTMPGARAGPGAAARTRHHSPYPPLGSSHMQLAFPPPKYNKHFPEQGQQLNPSHHHTAAPQHTPPGSELYTSKSSVRELHPRTI